MKMRVPMVSSVLAAATPVAAVLIVSMAGSAWAGSVKGTVKLDGAAPQRRQLQMAADPKCEAANPGGRQGEVYVVSPTGGMQYVFVYAKEGVTQKPAAPTTPATIDQHGCMYSPHVLGIQVGQDLEIKNSDATLHNIHALPTVNKQFNNAMPMQNMTIKKKFTSPEVMVHVKCDVHPWMSAYIGVLDHPYYAVTGADGTFEIKDLPAGEYTIEAWHEAAGTQTQKVTVPADGAATADFSFKPAAPAAAPGA